MTSLYKKALFKNPFVWAFVIGVITLAAIRPFLRHVPEPPVVLAQLSEFTLTNQDGRPFGSQDLKGKVYVANFIFTSCPSLCPKLTQNMAKLQERLHQASADIRLVSISVDPETDTPEKLKAYGEKFGADFDRWTFLTGSSSQLHALIEQGFMQHLGQKEPAEGTLYDIAHSSKFALVDQAGNLRGFYDVEATSENPSGVDEIFHRSQHVLQSTQ